MNSPSAAKPDASALRRVIAVGHAALDRIYRIQSFPAQPTKIRALEHLEVGGGMAANAAVAIARLGGRAELWSRVGGDQPGNIIRAGLKAERVDTRYVEVFDDARSSTSAVIVDAAGERMIIANRDTGMPSDTSWLPLERIKDAHAVLGDVCWLEGVRAAFTAARAAGVPTILDCDVGAREVMADLLAMTDYAIFSAPALAECFPAASTDQARLEAALDAGALHAGVTRGANGYLWRERGTGGEMPAVSVHVIDTTGAGDAFHGAFALMVAEGKTAGECARWASTVAALKCTRLGARAGLPTRAEAERRLPEK